MTIRVHHYSIRDNVSCCKYCGAVENKERITPEWCPGKPPKIEPRLAPLTPRQSIERLLANDARNIRDVCDQGQWGETHYLRVVADCARRLVSTVELSDRELEREAWGNLRRILKRVPE